MIRAIHLTLVGVVMYERLLPVLASIVFSTPVWGADLYAPVPPISDPIYTPRPMIVGHLELGTGIVDHGECDHKDCNHGGGIFVGAGRANLTLGSAWNIELETGGGAWFRNGEGFPAIGALGHLWRDLDSAAVGAFGGVYYNLFQDIEGTIGLEGRAYIGNLTLGASGSFNWGDNYDYWLTIGGVDFYPTPDFRLSGQASYYAGDFDGFGSFDHWNARVVGEYHFAGSPFAGWAEVSYTDYYQDYGREWAGLAGVRVLLNTTPETTLRRHDRDVPWHEMIGPRLYFQ